MRRRTLTWQQAARDAAGSQAVVITVGVGAAEVDTPPSLASDFPVRPAAGPGMGRDTESRVSRSSPTRGRHASP